MEHDPRTVAEVESRLDLFTLRVITLSDGVGVKGWVIAGTEWVCPDGEMAVLTRVTQTGWFHEEAFATAQPFLGLTGDIGIWKNGRRVLLAEGATEVQRNITVAAGSATNPATNRVNHLLVLDWPLPPWGLWFQEGDRLRLQAAAENWINAADTGTWMATLVLGVPLGPGSNGR